MQPTNWHRGSGNKVCLYCNEQFDGINVIATKEHLIGRNFVPRGSLNGGSSFNFIFKACRRCNNDKSGLEGHVSAVTQLMSPAVAENAEFSARAGEKSRGEIHPWTGRPVAESFHKPTLKFQGHGLEITTSFTGPPQLDRAMLNRLALRHVQGMYALCTNADHTAQSLTLLYPGWVTILGEYARGDWGNSQALAAFERVRDWKTYVRIVTAGGCFQGVLRRDDAEMGTWFWALEWNRYVRVIGGIA